MINTKLYEILRWIMIIKKEYIEILIAKKVDTYQNNLNFYSKLNLLEKLSTECDKDVKLLTLTTKGYAYKIPLSFELNSPII